MQGSDSEVEEETNNEPNVAEKPTAEQDVDVDEGPTDEVEATADNVGLLRMMLKKPRMLTLSQDSHWKKLLVRISVLI